MKWAALLIVVLGVACSALLYAVLVQRQELVNLRDEQKRLLSGPGIDANPEGPLTETASASTPTAASRVSPELLRLRNQVNLLKRRKRELDGIRSENEQLRLQVAQRQTNPPSALPPDYIRRNQARPVGYSTPENTLQSFLWALQNKNITNVLQAFTPSQAAWFQSEAQNLGSLRGWVEDSDSFIGFRIVSTQPITGGDMEGIQADIEIAPGLPPIPVNLYKIGDEWKLTSAP